MKKLILVAGLAACFASANATVLYSTGFETPTFAIGGMLGTGTTGNQDGQDGWSLTTTAWQVVGSPSGGVTAAGGSQMARGTISNTANAGRWTWKEIPALAAGYSFITASVDMFIPTTVTRNADVGIQLYDTAEGVCQLSVNASTGNVIIGGFATDSTGAQGVINGLKGAWHNYKVTLDFAAGKFDGFIDGISLSGGTGYSTGTLTSSTFSDMDLYLGNVTAGTGSNFIYYDNYKVEGVPEPATFVALGLGLAAVARRRSK